MVSVIEDLELLPNSQWQLTLPCTIERVTCVRGASSLLANKPTSECVGRGFCPQVIACIGPGERVVPYT